jgi:hypothetical protein
VAGADVQGRPVLPLLALLPASGSCARLLTTCCTHCSFTHMTRPPPDKGPPFQSTHPSSQFAISSQSVLTTTTTTCTCAQIIDELESTLPRWVQGPSWHPPFLHLLKLHPEATYEVSLSSVWSGIGAIERNLLGGQAEVALQVWRKAVPDLLPDLLFALPRC